MKEWIRRELFGREIDLRERMFRIFLVVGTIVSCIANFEEVVLTPEAAAWGHYSAVAGFFIVALVATFRFHKVYFSSLIIGFMMNCYYFPVVFFDNGAINSGAAVWFVIAIFYVFLMFTGKTFWFAMGLTLLTIVGCYYRAFRYPERVEFLPNESLEYLDSCFCVIIIGVAIGMVFMFQRKVYELERKLNEEQKEALEKAANAKNAFFAKMSHEIRTPINTIIGLNQINLREEQLPEEVIENNISIQNAGDMLLFLVNDILDMSQLENRKMKIIPGEYSTRQFFVNLVDLLHLRMKDKGLNFIIDIDSDIPSVLFGDEKRITQVMINILTNAVKYTNEGSVTLTARGSWKGEETYNLSISVADTGMGIRKEDLDSLFSHFSRLEEQKNSHIEGSGLGLSITKQLMDLMEGNITVDSIYTKGSTFTIYLDQKVIDPSPVGEMNFKKRKQANSREAYKQKFEAPEARVLVVDDDTMNHVVLQKLLRATKLQLDFATDWLEALEKTKQRYYHVIMLDHMMPDKDGIETLHEIRLQENGLCREVPAICLTGNMVSGADEMYKDAGFQGYLTKPIHGERLEEEILRFLPEEVIEFRRKDVVNLQFDEENHQYGYKKKKICITTDCVCDLSEEYINQYNIRQIYLYIETEHGRFCDTREMDSNNLFQYLTNSSSAALVKSAMVEDYEAFFAEALTEAEDVIHISLAAHTGLSYERAIAAAECFDHVHVVDSGHISGGQGILVLSAAQMVQQECSLDEILSELGKQRDRISSTFLLPTAMVLYQSGYVNKFVTRVCDTFNLHPVIKARNSTLTIFSLEVGNLEKSRRRFIRKILRKGFKVHTDYVIINHAACSVKELEYVKKEVQKCLPFAEIVLQKASVSTACSSGLGTIGISFLRK